MIQQLNAYQKKVSYQRIKFKSIHIAMKKLYKNFFCFVLEKLFVEALETIVKKEESATSH